VADSDWQMWSNQNATRGIILVNGKVPRGPVMGCHVAPQYWMLVVVLKFNGSVGVKPQTSPLALCFGRVWATTSPHGDPY
jgi:hypothetical protein